jgi:2-hydroxy-3-oxopropionate reductase
MLDAPVSGGEVGAINAALTIMVGGEEQAFARVRPVLECLGSTVTLVGGSGAGQVAKACNQILTGVGILAVAEALNFARASGVDPARVRAAMLPGFAGSRILEHHGERMLRRDFSPGFKAWMHHKDLDIVLQEARALGLATPAAGVAGRWFSSMVGQDLGEQDSIAVLQLLEELSEGADDAY